MWCAAVLVIHVLMSMHACHMPKYKIWILPPLPMSSPSMHQVRLTLRAAAVAVYMYVSVPVCLLCVCVYVCAVIYMCVLMDRMCAHNDNRISFVAHASVGLQLL